MTRHDYKPRHAAAARLLGECPFPSAADPRHSTTRHQDLRRILEANRERQQIRRDGWMQAQGTLAARLAGWRGRLACWLLGVG
jgi:hypothetical protein